jgi:putative hydrolase of the HAD superfamily
MIQTRHYAWVFLDAGETLFRVASPQDGYAGVLAQLGYPMTPGQMATALNQARRLALVPDHVGPGPDYAISPERARARRERLLDAILRGIGVAESDYRACRAALWESFVGRELFALYPEVPAVLDRLRTAGYRLGVISNWEPRLDELCRNHGLGQYFKFVLASEAEGFAKPGPRLFRRALDLAQVEPAQAVHVGDSYREDVLGATAVGINAVLLDRGAYYPTERWRPTIKTLNELPDLLDHRPHGHRAR